MLFNYMKRTERECWVPFAEAQGVPLLAGAESAAGTPAAAHPLNAEAVAEVSVPHVQEVQETGQGSPATAACGAGVCSPSQRERAGGSELSGASVREEQSRSVADQQEPASSCSLLAGAVADAQPAAANRDFDMVLSLLLPGLAIAAGPKRTADPLASPQAPSRVPPDLQAACAPAPPSNAPPPQLACAPAAKSVQALREGTDAAVAPEGQRERLRAFVYEQLLDGVLDTPWPEPPAGKLRVTDSGLCEGGLAERLFGRMGSTPAAAALLRALVCPITKVSCRACLWFWPRREPLLSVLTLLAWLQDFARDAVLAADGRTYEREAIEARMQRKCTSAARRRRLRSAQLFQNRLYSAVVSMLLRAF